ncbi:MAG: hypothetical protein EOP84_14600, partial [Verrucomicrobiaceae bacterium]
MEGNDTRATANDLSANFIAIGNNQHFAEITGTLSASGDGDYFRFYASPGDVLTINQSSTTGLDSFIYLYDENGQELSSDDDSGGGRNSLLTYTVPEDGYAGAYYIRAGSFSDSGVGDYYLSVVVETQSSLNGTLEAGTYFVVVETDAAKSVPETDEGNNSAASGPVNYIQSTVPADLVVETVTAPADVRVGESISLSWTVKNQGGRTAQGPWTDTVYLSLDGTLDGEDIVLKTVVRPTGSLLPGESSYTVNETVQIPAGLALGSYTIIVKADTGGAVIEGDDENNTNTSALLVQATDLVVSAGSVTPTTTALGNTIHYSFTVKNEGNVTIENGWYDAIYLSSDPVFDSSDSELYIRYSSDDLPFGSGASFTVEGNITLEHQLAAGAQYILFVTDRYNYVSETGAAREGNNTYSVPLTIDAPDLVVSGSTSPATAILNQNVEVSFTVRNDGDVAAAAGRYNSVFISTDAIFDPSDTRLRDSYSSATLAPDGTQTFTENVTIPDVGTGLRYLVFVADSYNYQGETDNTNNVRIVPISLNAPDLVLFDPVAPLEATVNGPIELSWSVRNDGGFAAPAGWHDYVYLSSDQTLGGDDSILFSPYTGSSPLAPGASYEQSVTGTVPQRTAGQYYLIFAADGSESQGETNEGNNQVVVPIILEAPDLVVSGATGPSFAILRETISLTYTVKNQGQVAAPASWYDHVYLSTTPTGTDYYLGQDYAGSHAPLAARP